MGVRFIIASFIACLILVGLPGVYSLFYPDTDSISSRVTLPEFSVFAQAPLNYGVATTFQVKLEEKEELSDGDILSFTDEQDILTRSKKVADERMFGVYVSDPIMVYRRVGLNKFPILRAGEAFVNMTTLGGDIKVGDFLTSSPISGKGQKAQDLEGLMLGTAISPLDQKSGTEFDYNGKKYHQGRVRVLIGIGPANPKKLTASGGIFGTLRNAAVSFFDFLKINKEISKWVRYAIAATVAILTLAINMRTFGRNVTKGIEAIGRNPMAKMSIQGMIVMNVVLIAILTLAGVILSIVIITL